MNLNIKINILYVYINERFKQTNSNNRGFKTDYELYGQYVLFQT